MLDSENRQVLDPDYEPLSRGQGRLTLHHEFLDNLTELLHMLFREIFAVLGCLQPFIRPSIAFQLGRPRLGDIAVCHGVGVGLLEEAQVERN